MPELDLEWELLLEDIQAVLYTFYSPHTKIHHPPSLSVCEVSDLSRATSSRIGSAPIQVSIAHPIHNDIILDSRSDVNTHTLLVRSANGKMTDEVIKINKLIQTYKFTSLMEACVQTFQIIDENITLTPEPSYFHTKLDTVCHYVVIQIDHMHDESRYLTHVQRFCKQTSVHALMLLAREIHFILFSVECKAINSSYT